jgi:cytochrome c-type biogenesis protein CcmH/NrfF
MRLRAAAALLAALALFPAAVAAAPEQRAQLTDLEDEVMCPICGTLLELTQAPQAERQRAFIAELIETGATKDEIKDALVAEYGDEVLAEPRESGFQLSAYLVPLIGFAAAAIAVAAGLWRWRRNSGDGPGRPGRPRAPSGEDAERLDADLARYDL